MSENSSLELRPKKKSFRSPRARHFQTSASMGFFEKKIIKKNKKEEKDPHVFQFQKSM